MNLDELYKTLREIVDHKFCIEIRDGQDPKVAIVPDSYEKFPWTNFGGTSLEDALLRAITKLRKPDMDYRGEPTIIDPEGYLWKADEQSIYSEEHTRLFLRRAEG